MRPLEFQPGVRMEFVIAAVVAVVVLTILMVVRRRGSEDGDLSLYDVGREVSGAVDRHRPEKDHLSGPGNHGF